MHTRRLVTFLLGIWIFGTLFVAYISNASLNITRAINENPNEAASSLIEPAGSDRVNTLTRYTTAEIQRAMVESWEWVQVGIGLAIVCTMPFALRMKWLYFTGAVIMWLIVICQRWLLTPEMLGIGRMLDFAGGNLWTQDALWKERRTLRLLDNLYLALDGTKLLLALTITGGLIIFRRKAAYKKLERVDSVDHTDHSHVNR